MENVFHLRFIKKNKFYWLIENLIDLAYVEEEIHLLS